MRELPERPLYTETEEQTWSLLFQRQVPRIEEMGCRDFLDGLNIAGFQAETIPSLRELSKRVYAETHWRLSRVDGLVPIRPFFELVAARQFPATDFIRRREDLDYTPAPDLFHDQFGHVPLLTQPAYAHFFQRFGEAGMNAGDVGVTALARIYWYTVEFGLVRDRATLKAFGAGLMSSIGELDHAMSPGVTIHPFDLDAMAGKPFITTEIQQNYFEIPSFEELALHFERWAIGRGFLADGRGSRASA